MNRSKPSAASRRLPRWLRFAVFVVVLTCVVVPLHAYIWLRLLHDPELPRLIEIAGSIALFGLCVSVPFGLAAARSGQPWTLPLVWVSSVWFGLLSILVVVIAGADALRVLARLVGATPLIASARSFAVIVASLTAMLGAVALWEGLRRVAVRELDVQLERLPRALDGLTIVQLSDLHIGPIIGRTFIERIVAQVNATTPDLIAITGDLVDGSVEQLRERVAPLTELRARFGVYFVTGNHEYYSGAQAWCAEIERLGIRVLRNERVVIGREGESFDLAGIDDLHAQRTSAGEPTHLMRALAGHDPTRELILLAHQPIAVKEACTQGVGLQLSGHTHGGQIWPWNYLVRLQQPVVSGLARFGSTQLYVSKGTGYWGAPMRLAAPAEITRLRLRSRAVA